MRALVYWSAVEAPPKGKKARARTQEIFNQWSSETKRPLAQLSMILALSVD